MVTRLDAGAASRAAANAAAPPVPGGDTHRRWWKRALPRSLYGRSLIIIILPLVLAELIGTGVFYDRVWDTVIRRLADGVASDIGFTVDAMRYVDNDAERATLFRNARRVTDLAFGYLPDETLPPGMRQLGHGQVEDALAVAIANNVRRPFQLDGEFDPRDILISVQLDHGVLQVAAPRKRLYTPTGYIFVLWMVGSGIVLVAIASLFMRNQVRALRRLADAADSFGKGRDVPNFRPEGATEVRRAAAAFLKMRERLQRQLTQRTEMLAGVSHDLRTPLTRMKLALEFLTDNQAAGELQHDVAVMQRMIEGYLDFARGEGQGEPEPTDLAALVEDAAAVARRAGAVISVVAPEQCVVPLRPDAVHRCLANLIGNAQRYGGRIWLTVTPLTDSVTVLVDDDGPGIPAAERENVFRPFFRLDSARSPATEGVGLGLTIARDVARGHGGDLRLEESPRGGLRVRLTLPK
ncbi:MAG TPA: ATP-binding protein [Stellaceae bacterium]|nr:ATP-binding protein [Stellaceae bacterium]